MLKATLNLNLRAMHLSPVTTIGRQDARGCRRGLKFRKPLWKQSCGTNRLAPTDHTHLGQIITYAAGLDGRSGHLDLPAIP